MKLHNLLLALQDQGPPGRFFHNFFITRNAWGLFSKNSHVAAGSGKPKVMYNTKASSLRAADAMKAKHDASVAALSSAKYQAEAAESQMRQFRESLNKTSVLAPMDGVITSLISQLGEKVVGVEELPLRGENFGSHQAGTA